VSQDQLDADVAGLASLTEPTRRALYLYVYAQDRPVSRDEAAAGVGVPRHRAKFHLDRLVDDGLLKTEFARRTGRQGPGAGRPAKFYRRGTRELAVTLPERRYELAGQLMARAISEAQAGELSVAETLQRAARERGRSLAGLAQRRAGDRPAPATLLAAARGVLDDEGYDTRSDSAGLTLANCPFRALAAEHTALVCGMNLAIMEGLLERLGRLHYAAVLDPAEGRCCVRLVPEGRS
jgi:predicted ArsR family transcriptional regulator